MNLPSLLSLAFAAACVCVPAAAQDFPRRSGAPVASVPSTAPAGAPRILLVDDDYSDNNHYPNDSRLSPSDRVFRKLVADAVGGDAKAWSIEAVKPYASGPGIERLRPFSLIVWYTAAIYGGNPDNTGVLSIEDEKTLRRYLQEVGGAVILISPGYASKVLGASGTWEKSDWPFLTEVLGIRGGIGLAQRFLPGTVTATGGRQFSVGKGGPVETQFSLVNPGGASVLFTTVPSAAKAGSQPAPVATANAFGKGRIVYVGFTFENLADADLAPAFQTLLAAAGAQASPAMSVSRPQATTKRQAAAPDPGPLTLQVSGTPTRTVVTWTLPTAQIVNAGVLGPAQTARKAPAAPAPGPTVVLETRELPVPMQGSYWTRMAVQPGESQFVHATSPGSSHSYRVTVTDASGATGSKTVDYTAPPGRDPQSLAAVAQSDGSVILSWPEVPGVTRYRVQNVPPTRGRIAPVVVTGATEWRSPPLDGAKRYWAVTSLYENHNGEYVPLTLEDSWPWAVTEAASNQYYLTSGTFTLQTGNDNKEGPSSVELKLYINGGETRPDNSANPNPLRLQEISHNFTPKDVELRVNSSADVKLTTSIDPNWLPNKNNLAQIEQHGLRLRIKYLPNFPLDAWKLESVTLKASFQTPEQLRNSRPGRGIFSPGMENRTVTFNVARLLTERDNQIDLVTDGALRPIP